MTTTQTIIRNALKTGSSAEIAAAVKVWMTPVEAKK